VRTVIVDEIHAIAGGKRGAHLALSLERLDDLRAGPPAQRIGLSATVRPPEELARFLSGQSPTTIVAPPSAKTVELTVEVPVPDMANLANNTIWPDVEARLVDLIESHSSTIVFANSRRLAERLTSRLNEIHAERCGIALAADGNPQVPGGAPAHIMARAPATTIVCQPPAEKATCGVVPATLGTAATAGLLPSMTEPAEAAAGPRPAAAAEMALAVLTVNAVDASTAPIAASRTPAARRNAPRVASTAPSVARPASTSAPA